jgi:guanylate kinase
MKKASPLLIIISSPSGAGKTTLCNKLLEEFNNLRFSTSHTTRKPRQGEVDGKDYFFVRDDEFESMIENELFIEWAYVHGHRYGTARAEVRAAATAGKDLLFDVDFQGAQQIKEQYPNAVGVFVLPPSIQELQNRLRARGTETPESLNRRFKAALEEIANHHLFDYLVVNDNLEAAYDQIRAILIAERTRHERIAHVAKEMLDV